MSIRPIRVCRLVAGSPRLISGLAVLLSLGAPTLSGVSEAQAGERDRGDPVALVLDDGTREEDWLNPLIEHYLINRFTPSEFPILLDEIQFFVPESPFPEEAHQLAVFVDPDGLMIRGFGTVAVPVELQSFSVE